MSGIISKLLANRGGQSRRYPHSTASVGPKIGVIHGKDCWWEAVGPALGSFKELVPDIKKQLESYCEPVSGSTWITFSVYMIGKQEETAAPTIMFFSEESAPRKDAMSAVKRSGILRQYPGFRVGNRARAPDVNNLVQPATDPEPLVQRQGTGSAVNVFYDPSKPIRSSNMVIYVKHENECATSMRAATANAIRHGDRFLYFSVSHAFTETISCKVDMEDHDSDYEIASDNGEDYDEDYDEEEDVVLTSCGSRSSNVLSDNGLSDDYTMDNDSGVSDSSMDESVRVNELSSQQWDSELLENSNVQKHITSDDVPKQVHSSIPNNSIMTPMPPSEDLTLLGSLIYSSADKDWALISIENEEVMSFLAAIADKGESTSMEQVARGARRAPINTRLPSSGGMGGMLSETPLYTRLPNGKTFQEVYKVQLDGSLANGDCGAAIFDAETDELYGHIIAGCEISGVAYIIPSHHIFEDFEEHLGSPVRLLPRIHPRSDSLTADSALTRRVPELFLDVTGGYPSQSYRPTAGPFNKISNSSHGVQLGRALYEQDVQSRRGLGGDSYRRRDSTFFCLGKVFKVPWPEPTEDLNPRIAIREIISGHYVARKYRWFVVLREDRVSCTCLPIQTLKRQGVGKPGVRKSYFAIISTDNEPQPQPLEEPLREEMPMRQPIRVRPTLHGQELDVMSRLNFAVVCTVEHNIEVSDFGDVVPEHIHLLIHHFRAVQDDLALGTLSQAPRSVEFPRDVSPLTQSGCTRIQQAGSFHDSAIGEEAGSEGGEKGKGKESQDCKQELKQSGLDKRKSIWTSLN